MVRSSVLRTNMWDTTDRTAHWMNATNNSYKCIKRRRDFLADDQRIASFCCDISQKSDDKMRNMTKMSMDDKNHLYLSEKSRMIDS